MSPFLLFPLPIAPFRLPLIAPPPPLILLKTALKKKAKKEKSRFIEKRSKLEHLCPLFFVYFCNVKLESGSVKETLRDVSNTPLLLILKKFSL